MRTRSEENPSAAGSNVLSAGNDVLSVDNLGKHYEVKKLFGGEKGTVKALDGVSFQLKKGETLAVVGESGCGKSTLAKALMQVESPSFGKVEINGQSIADISAQEFRHKMQMVFQDPYSSVNPRKKVGQIIAEPKVVNGGGTAKSLRREVQDLMQTVGLRPEYIDRYPHMFSGGQRQRIGLARALMMRPEILICDEPVSALDISIQAQVINLLMELQNKFSLSYIFITHDLSVVRHLADSVMVMYLGKVVEYGPRGSIFADPQHPYTKALLSSTPTVYDTEAQEEIILQGELPSPLEPPSGCAFHKRCPWAKDNCKTDVPSLDMIGDRVVACLYVKD